MAVDPVFLNWQPSGNSVAVSDAFQLVDIHDGDTPNIRMPIRMLSVDTPEITARTPTGAEKWDEQLLDLAGWIQSGHAPIDEPLAAALLPKLDHGKAGTLQFTQGQQASAFSKANVDQRLTRPNGTKRSLFVRTADEPFDDNGRLLAYIAPNYSKTELQTIPPKDRPTFNLDLLREGWAVPFMIYPSLPKSADLALYVETVKGAIDAPRGIWTNPLSLPAYEYRMLEKLWGVAKKIVDGATVSPDERKGWRSRWCIDMSTRKLFGPEAYAGIAHQHRLWVWPKDLARARADFNLIDA